MTEIFSDGFETGNFNAWTGTSGTPSIITDPVHHGTYAMMCNAVEYAYKTLASSQPFIYHRCYVRTNTVPASGEYVDVMWGRATSTTIFGASVGYSGGVKWRLCYRNGATWTNYWTSIPAVVNTWYCVEIYWKLGASDGQVQMWIDGELAADLKDLDTDNYGNCTAVRNGVLSEGFAGAFEVVEDCVVVADAYIGEEGAPPEGQPYISRVQQVSGMQTFNPIHALKPLIRRMP